MCGWLIDLVSLDYYLLYLETSESFKPCDWSRFITKLHRLPGASSVRCTSIQDTIGNLYSKSNAGDLSFSWHVLSQSWKTSAFSLIIASIIATIIFTQFVALLNQSERPSISAGFNNSFLGTAWSAVIIQTIITIELIIAMMRYRARHCRCDWKRLPTVPTSEQKRAFFGFNWN